MVVYCARNAGVRPHPRDGSADDDTPSLSLQCILAISLGGLGAFLLGRLLGLGHFLVGLSWIAESFYVDAEQCGALAIPAIGGLSSFLALFPATACGIGKILGGVGWRLFLAFAASWSAAE